jgi:DNA-directed RNA polymerase specialized sigma24 family protein
MEKKTTSNVDLPGVPHDPEELHCKCLARLEAWLKRKFPRDIDHHGVALHAILYCRDRPLKWNQEENRLPPYLLTVAEHRAIDEVRKLPPQGAFVSLQEPGIQNLLVAKDDPQTVYGLKCRKTFLLRTLNAIPRRERFCVILVVLNGRTFKQAAKRLGLKPWQVSYAVRKGLERIKRVVQKGKLELL